MSLDISAFQLGDLTTSILRKVFIDIINPLIIFSAPHIDIYSGNNQQGNVNQLLAEPFRVKTFYKLFGSKIYFSGVPVNVYWQNTTGGGQLQKNITFSNFSTGIAENYLTLGNNSGENRVTSYLKKADGTVHSENIFSAIASESGLETGTVTDIEGNVYKTVKIGNQ